MSAIPVWERVNRYQPMVKACGNLVDWVRTVLDPVLGISREIVKGFRDLVRRYADVLLSAAVCPCPAPRVAEHPAMQFAEKARLHYRSLVATIEEPVQGEGNICLLPSIQLTSVDQVRWDQVGRFVFIERSVSLWLRVADAGFYCRCDGPSSSQMCRDQFLRSFSWRSASWFAYSPRETS